MKFSQAMAKLEENRKLKFTDSRKEVEIYVDEVGFLMARYLGQSPGFSGNIEFHNKWELIQEPVDFTTAFKAWQEGKVVSLEVDDDPSRHKQVRKDYCTMNFNMRDVESGKWYVE